VTKSASEAFLLSLADRTFLKLWAIPNTFYKAGKELTDLIVPFGDDIIILSDKASSFDFGKDPDIAWSRWYAKTVEEGMRQLKTAMQRVQRNPETVFTDGRATKPIAHQLGPIAQKRFHLVAIARPHRDPNIVPEQWPGLTYVAPATVRPFEIGPLTIGETVVHVFDGPTIDLLLRTLDTAPDFIAYLRGRAERLRAATRYRFAEPDLLAAALVGWDHDPLGRPSVSPFAAVMPGHWEQYRTSETARRREAANQPSRVIDAYIARQHREYEAGRMLGERPGFDRHERAMRYLAAESRFARRIIAHELHDILTEADQSTFWASTVASPTTPGLRYVWLIYPDRPAEFTQEQGDAFLTEYLQQHIVVARTLFDETLVLGIALPNRESKDTANYTSLLDGSNWTEAHREEGLALQALGIFENLEAQHRFHIR